MLIIFNNVSVIFHFSILDKHIQEKEILATGRITEIRDQWLKDALLRYVEFFPQVSSHLEKNIDCCTYGIGELKSCTYSEMWQLYNEYKSTPVQKEKSEETQTSRLAYMSVRQWLLKSPKEITSGAMKRFRQYVLKRDENVSLEHYSNNNFKYILKNRRNIILVIIGLQ